MLLTSFNGIKRVLKNEEEEEDLIHVIYNIKHVRRCISDFSLDLKLSYSEDVFANKP